MDREIPQQATHFFTRADMRQFSEYEYRNFEEVSQLARSNGTTDTYQGLREAVRKFVWMKLAADRILQISSDIAETSAAQEEGVLFADFAAHSDYERNLLEFIGYAKAILDGLSTFLNRSLALGQSNQGADIKWRAFREMAAAHAPELNDFFAANEDWLNKDSRNISSIFATRDEWLHRGSPQIYRHWPHGEHGPLPISSSLDADGVGGNETVYWKIEDFIEYHLSRVRGLIRSVVGVAIARERVASPNLKIDRMHGPASFYPLRKTMNGPIKGLKLRI